MVADPLTGTGAAAAPAPTDFRGLSLDRVTGIAGIPSVERVSELFTYIVTLDTEGLPLADRAREVLESVRPQALFSNLGMLTVRLTAAQAQALARRPGVLGVEQDQTVTLSLPDQRDVGVMNRRPGGGGDTSSPPPAEVLDWGVKWVWGDVDRRSALSAENFSARVYVLDTGISATTSDLTFNEAASRDFTGSRSGFYDKNGHGTHVAGTIAAKANAIGVVGVAPGAEVISYKVLNDRGSGTYSGIIAAIDAVISNAKVGDVVNLSLGGGLSTQLNAAIQKAAAAGILFAIAAGNEYQDVDRVSPASAGSASDGIFTVSAHNSSLRNASFTNYDIFGGNDVDNVAYSAPGVGIVSLKIDGTTTALSGTSMAAPHVAGLLVLGGTNAFSPNAGSAGAYGSETTDPLAIWSGTLA